MDLQEYLKNQKEYHEELDERFSSTVKQRLKDQEFYKILLNSKRRKAFKRLSGLYPHVKQTKFISDLIKEKDTQAKYKHVHFLLKEYVRKLENIQYAEESKKTVEFTKDRRVKILSHGVKQLQLIEREIRLRIKASEDIKLPSF